MLIPFDRHSDIFGNREGSVFTTSLHAVCIQKLLLKQVMDQETDFTVLY